MFEGVPSEEVAPSSHEAVDEDAGDGVGDGGYPDPAVGLRVDVADGLRGLGGVEAVDDGTAVGGQRAGVEGVQVGGAHPARHAPVLADCMTVTC